jgi:hypothetical protein
MMMSIYTVLESRTSKEWAVEAKSEKEAMDKVWRDFMTDDEQDTAQSLEVVEVRSLVSR